MAETSYCGHWLNGSLSLEVDVALLVLVAG